MWCVTKLDDEYIKRMEDILRLYGKPYKQTEPVICFDEKSVQLLSDTYPSKPCRPGRVAQRDHEYVRHGTANVFCCIEPKAGRHFVKVTLRRTALDFAEVLRDISKRYPKARTIHLVMDNLNTHCLKSLIERFGEKKAKAIWKQFTVHYTPKHASWLNQAEIQISAYSRAVLRHARVSSTEELKTRSSKWMRKMNKQAQPFQWRFSTKDSRKIFKYKQN